MLGPSISGYSNSSVTEGPFDESGTLANTDPTVQPPPTDITQNVDFEGRTKMFVSLFQIRCQHIFDPFHECADSARQIAPMCYDEGHGERPATKIGYDLHKRSTLQISANPQE
jgi:hypothetical protein